MATITYRLYNFNADAASDGALCVMVKKDYTDPIITNEPMVGVEAQPFGGAGTCKVLSGRYTLTVKSVSYKFDGFGNPLGPNNTLYKLMLGEIQQAVSDVGNTVNSKATVITEMTQSDSGDIEYNTTVEGTPSTVFLDSLTPRDQFAINALRSMLEHVQDPSSVSDSVMADYCDKAYRWAANMMNMAADARAIFKDSTATDTPEAAEVGVLEDNKEKLLNNIILALERTDEKETTVHNNQNITNYYERVSVKNWKDLIDSLEILPRNNVYYAYRNKVEANQDGWIYNNDTLAWTKLGYDDVPGANTDTAARTLPTYRYVQKVSIVEMEDVVNELAGIKEKLGDIATILSGNNL